MAETLAEIRRLLRINKRRLDDELEQQTEIGERIGSRVARLHRREAEAKRELEVTEAALISEMVEADPKLALNRAQLEVKRKRAWRDAHDALLDAREELASWEALDKAWYARGFDLKALVELFNSEYFTRALTGSQRDMRDADVTDYVRREQTRARRRISEGGEPSPQRARNQLDDH